MTEETPKHSVFEKPNLDFARIPHEKGMTYEFDLRTEVNPLVAKFFESHHKAQSLPPDPSYVAPKRGAVFDFFFNNSGHVFFNLVMKKDGKEIGHSQIGFSADKYPDPEKAAKLKIAVPGAVFDQEKSDPSYHFNKTFPLDRDQFDSLVAFVNKSIENPPPYHWPVAMNCVRFTQACAEAAKIPEAKKIGGLIDLPVSTQLYLAGDKMAEKLVGAAEKIKSAFSGARKAALPEKKNDSAVRKLVADRRRQR